MCIAYSTPNERPLERKNGAPPFLTVIPSFFVMIHDPQSMIRAGSGRSRSFRVGGVFSLPFYLRARNREGDEVEGRGIDWA